MMERMMIEKIFLKDSQPVAFHSFHCTIVIKVAPCVKGHDYNLGHLEYDRGSSSRVQI
jgi:hypothetical protein